MPMTCNRTVSLKVRELLPPVLIEYLWDLAVAEQAPDNAFILKTQALGGHAIQEILHFSGCAYIVSHKVFGFDPVNAVIRITEQGGDWRMEAGGLPEAVRPAAVTD